MSDEPQGQGSKPPAVIQTPRPPIVAGATVAAIVPTTFEEAFRLGTAFQKAGMAPKSLNTPEGATGAILAGMEIGLTPYAALQSFANINGRTSLWGDAIPALLWSHGFKLKEWTENSDPAYPDNMVAKCIVTRPDGTEIEGEFSVADAKEAKLWTKEGPWQTAKKRMMKMRARAFAARDGAPDVLRGIPIYEEVADYVDFEETPRAPRNKRDLKARLQAPAAEQEPEETVHAQAQDEPEVEVATSENGDQVDQTTGEVVVEGGAAPEVEATLESDGPTDEAELAWWQKTDISEGHARPGERYRLASDEAGDDGRVPTYGDGKPFSSAGEKGSLALRVYRAHPPAAENSQETDQPAAGQDGAGTQEKPFLAHLPDFGSWAGAPDTRPLKPEYVAMTKTDAWQAGAPEDQDIALSMIRARVEELQGAGDPVSHTADPTYFLVWVAGEEQDEDGAVAIETALADLEKSESFKKLSPEAQDRVRNKAGARINAIREGV